MKGNILRAQLYLFFDRTLPLEYLCFSARCPLRKTKTTCMKVKHSLILIATGYIIYYFGLIYKTTHAGAGDKILIVAAAFKIVGVVAFLIKLVTYPKKKDFLNW